MRIISKRPGRRRGTTLVETAIAMGACLFFLFGIYEYGRFVMISHLLDNAAREGARQAVANTHTMTTADIQSTVTTYMANQPVTIGSFSVYMADPSTGANTGTWNDAKFGEGIAVDIHGTYKPMLPTFGFLPTTVTMNFKVIMLSEAN